MSELQKKYDQKSKDYDEAWAEVLRRREWKRKLNQRSRRNRRYRNQNVDDDSDDDDDSDNDYDNDDWR